MKKADLIALVQEMTDGTQVQAREIVEGIFEAIAQEMAKGGVVDIAGHGKYEGRNRAARTARNPRTGEAVMVPAKRVPKFKAAKALKDIVAAG